MGLFSIIGDVLSTADEVFFGPPGVSGGIIGSVVNVAIENPGKTVLVVGATVASGGLALAAAPTIAATAGSAGLLGLASTGTVISSLSGAALTSASLASVAGGTLAGGAGGMAAGITTITTAGAATGAAVSSVIAISSS